MSISRVRLLAFIFSVLYIYFLCLDYKQISIHYGYMGYLNGRGVTWNITFSLLIFLALSMVFFLPRVLDKPSSLVIWAIYYIVFIPSLFVPYFMNELPSAVVLEYGITMFICLLLMSWCTTIHKFLFTIVILDLYRFRTGLMVFVGLLVIVGVGLTFYLLFPIIHFTGMQKMYVQRAVYIEFVHSLKLPGFTYLFSWVSQVFAPLILAIGIMKCKKIYVLFAIIVAILCYGISAEKSILLIPIVVVFFYVLLHRLQGKVTFVHISFIFMLMVALGLIVSYWNGVFVRRVIITPGMLSSWYIDFSLHNPLTYMSGSILKFFIQDPYKAVYIPRVVSKYVSGSAYDANANLWASSAVQFGYVLGPAITTVLLTIFLKLYDAVALALKNIRYEFFILSVIGILPFTNSIVNTELMTSLLTHGGLIVLIFLYVYLCVHTCKLSRGKVGTVA